MPRHRTLRNVQLRRWLTHDAMLLVVAILRPRWKQKAILRYAKQMREAARMEAALAEALSLPVSSGSVFLDPSLDDAALIDGLRAGLAPGERLVEV